MPACVSNFAMLGSSSIVNFSAAVLHKGPNLQR
jgi:hypothetical protein